MLNSGNKVLVSLLCAVICVAAAGELTVRLWPPVAEGIEALSWPTVPGQIVYATFHSDYNGPESWGMDGEVRDDYTSLRVAYWASEGEGAPEPLVTDRFDTATGLWKRPGPLTGKAHETRHVLAAGDALRVRYNPRDPTRAVVYPGPPWSSATLMALPVMLFGLAIAFLRWGFGRKRAVAGGYGKRKSVDHGFGALLAWPVVFLAGVVILAGLLPPLCVRLFGRMLPWWVLPGVYAVSLICFAMPVLLRYPPMRELGFALMLGLPLTLVGGLTVLAMEDHRATFGTDLTDEEVVRRLDADHPAMAEYAAWTVMRRNGPRAAAPALKRLLQSPAVDTRRAAAVALTRVGLAGLPALSDVEIALRDPANAGIRDSLLDTQETLRGYIWLQEQVEAYRHQLLFDDDGQSRNGAAFSLGQIGEAAVSAIPDLERAARDPRNRDFVGHMESVIERLKRFPAADEDS
jgi:hypothetical protein